MQVPEGYSFWDLHVAIVDAMGWFDYHLHEFTLTDPVNGERVAIGMPDPDGMDWHVVLPDHEKRIADYFSMENPRADYLYDFGDDWRHSIVLEEIVARKKRKRYPSCLDGGRACPPEDCGGVHGYEEFLRIISDPSHEEYQETLTWVGGSYDPERFDPRRIHFDDPGLRWRVACLGDDEAYAELMVSRVFTYVNRKGDRYFLKEGTTKMGGTRYYLTKDPREHLLKGIPDGYEVYESPSARVFCRRVRPVVIRLEEKATVDSAVRAAGFSDFIVDVKKNTVAVYMPDFNAETLSDIAVAFGLPRIEVPPEAVKKVFKSIQQYTPMMRFVLTDKKGRMFTVERYCFSEGIDDWIHLDGPASIKKLANKYCGHLGDDSFYDL